MPTALPIAQGSTGAGGASVGTTQAVQLTSGGRRFLQELYNLGPGNLCISRDPTNGASLVYGAPGSKIIPPGQAELYPVGGSTAVPTGPTWGISDTGCTVTGEVI